MNPADIAWFAGLFEGEGWIGCSDRGRLTLEITMVDRDIIDRVQRLAGGSVSSRLLPSGKRAHHWSSGKNEQGAAVAMTLLPFLGQRRTSQVATAITKWRTFPVPKRLKTHCLHGHPLAGANLFVHEGRRRCKSCRKERVRQYRARKAVLA